MKNKGWVWVAVVFFVVLNGCVVKFDKGTPLKNPIKRESLKLNHEGNLLLKKGEHSLALKKFDEAIKIDPNNDHAYVARGLIYKITGQFDKGIQEIDKAISINPNNPIYYSNKASIYLVLDKPEEAILLCDKVLSKDPKAYYAYGNRMLAYLFLSQYDEAEQDLEKLNELSPNLVLNKFGRGVIDYHKNEPEKAIKNLKEVVDSEEERAVFALFYLGKCYEAIGNKNEALSYYKQYIDFFEQHPESINALVNKPYLKEAKDRIKELEVEEK